MIQDQGKGAGKTNFSGGPFYTTSVPAASNSRLSPLPHEPADFYDPSAPVDIPLDSTADLKKKKERELQARETDLKRREDVRFVFSGIVLEEKNWPPFFPIIHHDIANEIPIHLQKLQYVAFTTYLAGLVLCLLWNIIAATTWIKGEDPRIWFLALIYFISGVPLTYILWYRPGLLKTRGILPLPAVDLVGKHALVGIFYFVGFGLFCLELLLSIWVVQKLMYPSTLCSKHTCISEEAGMLQMKREVARSAVRAAI
ncbi:hypothetical protein R6Q57_003589 [Mikania cordata]